MPQKGLPVGSLYVLLYKKLKAEGGSGKHIPMKDARSVMSRPFGLDKLRMAQVVQEMEAYGFVAAVHRDHIVLNEVVVPDV